MNPADVPEAAPPPVDTRRRMLPLERFGAFIEVVLCSGLPTQILVIGVLASLGMRAREGDGGFSAGFVIALTLIDMALVLGLVCMFLRAHGERVGEFLIGRQRIGREVLVGLLAIPAAFLLVVLVLMVVLAIKPELHNVPVNPFERMMQTPQDAAIFAVVAMLAGGVREEVQRAFIVRRFDQYLGGGVLGILIYGGIFGLGHIEQGHAAVIVTGTLGIAWGFLYRARGSVVAPMVCHAGFNLAQLVKYVIRGS
jgi:membrane protease YdiL (CAAX protease family)